MRTALVPTVAPTLALALLLSAWGLLAGCGQTRRYGDDGGRPVAFTVHVDRPFVKSMHYNQWRPSAGAGAAVGSGGSSSVGVGLGFSFSATHVDLLGGDGPAEAQVFIHELKWGDNAFSVPLTPGRKLHLTAKASGGREGWESIGEITVPRGADPRVAITLDANGVKLLVTPVEAPVAPAAPAPAAASPASPASPAKTTDGGPAVERSPAPAPTPAPPAPSALPEASPEPPAAPRAPDAPVLEHASAGDKPPSDHNPPMKLDPGPGPGTAPAAAPAAAPATSFPDPTLDHP